MTTLAKRVSLLFAMTVGIVLSATAQQLNVGGITGTVRDGTGGVMPDVL